MGRSPGEFYAGQAKGVTSPPVFKEGGAKRRGGQVLPVGEANISNPVTRPARKTRFNIFAFEVSGGSAKPRWVDIFEHVDVDDRIEMVRDLAGNQRHGAAPRADVKRSSPGPEGIPRRNLGRVSFPFELEGDIAAVAFTGDEHVDIGAGRAPQDRVEQRAALNAN